MKIDILYVHIAVVAAVFIPYILFIILAARERKNLRTKFFREAKKLQLKFDHIDTWNRNIIGLDKHQQKLLLLQQKKDSVLVQAIDLKNVKNVLILEKIGSVKINSKKEDILQRLDLELCFYNAEPKLLNLFDSDEAYYQDYEMKNARKWCKILNDSLRLRPLIHSAA